MNDIATSFRSIRWSGNSFSIAKRTEEAMHLNVYGVVVGCEAPSDLILLFERPRDEWARIWVEAANEWREHPDRNAPIGNAIVEAFAKPIGNICKFSFAGSHSLGWSRWGFVANALTIARCET